MRVLICLVLILLGGLNTDLYAENSSVGTLDSIRAFVQISDKIGTSGQPTPEQIMVIKNAGYELVVNLAPASEKLNASEGFLVTSTGMSYVQIPVDFKAPQLRDLEFFFQVMNAKRDRKVFVHCFANMRVSSFMYLYRVIHDGVPRAEAKKALNKVWEPNGAWPEFIEKALAKYATN